MTGSEVAFWAAVYVIGGVVIWTRTTPSRQARLGWLAAWSTVGLLGTTASAFVCVATHYEHVPGDPLYCEASTAADVAFFGYPGLALAFGLAAGTRWIRHRASQSRSGGQDAPPGATFVRQNGGGVGSVDPRE